MVMSYVIHPFRPSLRFDRASWRKLFAYGKFLTLTAILAYVVTKGDGALVGKLFGRKELAYYALAFNLTIMVSAGCMTVFSTVSFPAFSEMAGEPARFREAFVNMTRAGAYVTLPLTLGLLCVGGNAVLVMYGEKWLPAVIMVQMFSVQAALRVMSAPLSPALQALGKPHVDTVLVVARLVLLAAGVALAAGAHGTVGVCGAVVGSALIVYSCRWVSVVRGLSLPLRDLAAAVRVPLLACCSMGLAIAARRLWLLPDVSARAALGADVVMGGVGYVGTVVVLNALRMDDFVRDLLDRRRWS
jgi:O-antigen/teichoic acid export membrane protein